LGLRGAENFILIAHLSGGGSQIVAGMIWQAN